MDSNTDFVHQLDARQRAMLKAMGITVWAPPAKPGHETLANPTASLAPVPVPVSKAEVRSITRPIGPSAPTPAVLGAAADVSSPAVHRRAVLAEHLNSLDSEGLNHAIATCQACGLCEGRRNAVPGQGSVPADWLVVGDAIGDAEDEQGQPFVGDEGLLLDNMLRAVGRNRRETGPSAAYVTTALKCRPRVGQKPSDAEIAQCATYLARQVALVRPRVIVLMGSLAVQAVLGSTEPLGQLRGRLHHFAGVPVVVTYPLLNLLSTPQNKAKAWDDLCLALKQ
jgi:uracil-DNA glycosylase